MAATRPTSASPSFSNKFVFSGHKGPVTCLSLSHSLSLLASSSEDRTIRIWDLNTKKCCKICLPNASFFKTSFSPSQNAESVDSPEITSIAFVTDHFLIAGIESHLIGFSLNTESVLIREEAFQWELGAGEINSIDVSYNSNQIGQFSILCACDSGVVVIDLDMSDGQYSTKVRKIENIHSAFISAAKWISNALNTSDRSFVSGGFDCKLNAVSLSGDGEPKVKSVDLNVQETQNSGNVKQMFNPPYVHSIARPENSAWAVATTGSGNLEFLHLERFVRADPVEIHASSANVVCFVRIEGIGEVMVTSGSDGILAVRSFSSPDESDVEKYGDIRTRQRELETRVATSKKPMSKPQQKLWINFKQQLSQLNGTPKTALLLKTKLSSKVNWITTTEKITPSGNLFLADTTNDILCLTLSMGSVDPMALATSKLGTRSD